MHRANVGAESSTPRYPGVRKLFAAFVVSRESLCYSAAATCLQEIGATQADVADGLVQTHGL